MDKFNVGQMIQVPLDVIAERHNIKINIDTNKFDTKRFMKLKKQLIMRQEEAIKKNSGVEGANEAIAIFDQVKKFLMDRSMLKVDKQGVWEPTPCLLDEDGNEVHFTEDTVVVRDKWAR